MAEEKKEAPKEEAGCGCGCSCCGVKSACACGAKRCGGGCAKAVIGFLLGILLTIAAVGLYTMGRCHAHGAVSCPMMAVPAQK